jgi:thymidylate synthase (FAD)
MQVKLISHSTAPVDTGLDNLQELIAFCAKHQHWSPLEMVSACLEIETTRDIAHQIVRHRSFAFQEFSQRYANPEEMGEQFVTRECRLQDTKNRQNSVDTEDPYLIERWEEEQLKVIMQAEKAYNWAIDNGIAKEQARVVLPEGCTKTRLYMNGTIRSWVHYIELRGANGTQKEHMDIAHACAKVIAEIFPLAKDL